MTNVRLEPLIYNNALICDTEFIKAHFPKYKKPYECSKDIQITMNEFQNLGVFKRECVVDGDLYDMINLEGTIPIAYKANFYHIPLRVMLREDYPATAPIIYVTPTEDMILGKNVPYVNSRGKISIQYLERWEREQQPDLYKVLHHLCVVFADNPPVWTKRTNAMVEAIEFRTLRSKLKDAKLTEPRQESQADATKARPGQSGVMARGFPSSEPNNRTLNADFSQGVRSYQAERPTSSFASPYRNSPSVSGTSSGSPRSVPHDSAIAMPPYQGRGNHQSVAYEWQSSGGGSSTKSSPSPTQGPFNLGGFVAFDPAQALSSPGSFVPDFSIRKNDNTDDSNNVKPTKPSSSEVLLSRSQSVPANLSQQEPCEVLRTYRCQKLIGSGGFAKVYLYENQATGAKVACKIVDLCPNDEHVKRCAEALKKEIRLLKTLKHEFIISYLSTEENDNLLAMVMEYFPKGSLYSELQRRPDKCFDEQTTRFFTWQIIQGVKYLHENAVIHRDIKARNILIDKNNIIKIADFGISKEMDDLITVTTASKDHFGSIYWQSPEYLGNKKYGRKTDVWSIGCTVVEMLVGNPPLLCDGITRNAAGMQILQGQVYPPENCSELAKEFLEHCFRLEATRPTARELMEKTEFPARSTRM